MSKPKIYISTDIEADGPIPGSHSMLSFASAAYTADKQLIDTFSANLDRLPNAQFDVSYLSHYEVTTLEIHIQQQQDNLPSKVILVNGQENQQHRLF